MGENALLVFFWGWPLLLGLFVWLTKASYAVQPLDRLESWLVATDERIKSSGGKIARYWGRPTSIVALSPFRVTAPLNDPFLRVGARVALVPYITGVIFVATIVALELAIAVGCFLLAFMLWGFLSNLTGRTEDEESYDRPRQPMSRIRGTRLLKTGLLGDVPTGQRIDETGRVMQEGFFGDSPTGVRIDEDGRILEEGFFGDAPAGYKIDAEGKLVREGFLGDEPTGTRIDEYGQIVEEGFLGDSPTGYKLEKQ